VKAFGRYSSLADVFFAAKSNVVVKTRKYHLSKYENCFVASELVDWLVSDGICVDRKAAVAVAASMASLGMLQHVVEKEKPFADAFLFFRFISPKGSTEEPSLKAKKESVGEEKS
jgi:hypothetical protein